MKNVKVFATIILAVISIACTSDDDTPVIETTITVKDFETTIDENPTIGQELGTIDVTTNQGTLIYSFKSEEPASAFAIDSKTGKLTVKENFLFDYETRVILTAIVLIKNGDLTKEAKVTIHLNDIEDSNITIKDFETTIDENPTAGQELGTIEATTDQGELTYSLKNETPEGAFEIDTKTGKFTVKDATLFDYETRTTLTTTVVVNNKEIGKEAKVIINLNDIEDATIIVKDFQTTIDENPTAGQELGTIEATTDQGELTYSLKNESPEGAFTIDSKTGKLTVKDATLFNYETRKTLTAIAVVNNKEAVITVTLNNVIENEIITFTDPNFKQALLEHTDPVIDTNGNGEISIEEAQVVKKINVNQKNISDLSEIKHFTSLTRLECSLLNLSNDRFRHLNVSKNTALEYLNCSGNVLTSLDLSKNTALTTLMCSSNSLTTLDISKNTNLTTLQGHVNKFTSINLKNGNNNALGQVFLQNNPSLTCIEVDDPSASYLTNWQKDATASYSSDCTP
ncbi:cadherin repeat domain-containing protein [Aquimarina sp. AU58]|uniref:cadherin repeat domain-containing protein n=1 Tax=Aquimarina sp. AU58 TaxID=1874112 RepID=UPI000D6E3F59|nr:cadherin repeat domain-containing protein [Aquimarina sp. AU58]